MRWKPEKRSWRSIEKLSNYRRAGVRDADGNWTWTSGISLNYSLGIPKDTLANCGPESVINGHSRILSAQEYEWVSDPKEMLPQWLQLQFAQPTEINTVSIVFDTDMSNPGTCWHAKYPTVPSCVKDYTVEEFDGSAWVRIAQEEGNFMRKRTHSFDAMTAQKLRITVKEPWGDPSARITEVRAALESE